MHVSVPRHITSHPMTHYICLLTTGVYRNKPFYKIGSFSSFLSFPSFSFSSVLFIPPWFTFCAPINHSEDRFDRSCDILYIYYTAEGWHIHTDKGSTSAYAFCPYQDLFNCSNHFYIYNGTGWAKDHNMRVIPEACPEWSCDEINVPHLSQLNWEDVS